ncbi:beta strand repeat-containing protein [Rhodoblastus sp.]|uniref:beta strand repeat-containing protein n=1 Tax=Rhodoblastus sp. TaxID=1962975 RepID=UPI003F9B72B7
MAEFYRVEASLIRANIPVVADRGLSDEGDPWFVYCNRDTGEIIVHFARYDGTYVVASPAFDSCARGRDFRALIEAQIESHPVVVLKAAGGGKLFIHPAALLIVLVTTCFFKLSQTTASAGELDEAQPPHPGVESLDQSDSVSQAVVLDERATAAVLAAIVTGIAWAQSHDFSLWSIGAALPREFDVPSRDLSGSTSSAVASLFDANPEDLFYARSHSVGEETPVARGNPSTTSSGYGPNDHSAAGRSFCFDTSALAASQTLHAILSLTGSAAPSAYRDVQHTEIVPVDGSTVSSNTTNGPVITSVPQENSSSLGAPIIGLQNAWLGRSSPIPSTTTYALTTGNDTNASLGHSGAFTANDLITGVINASSLGPLGSANTLNAGDTLVMSGATLSIVDIQHSATPNELAGVSLSGPFKFVVNESAVDGGSFDFTLASGATDVESLNSTSNVNFANLAAGTKAEISGSATPAGIIVDLTYASPTTSEFFQVDGGVSGVTFETPGISTDAPTTETILSTGASNGTAAQPDWFRVTNNAQSLTLLTVNATTSLVAGLDASDFTGAATLTVSGAAALVDLTPSGAIATFSTVSASGLTEGGLHLNASDALTSFTGGEGGNNELLYDDRDLSLAATAIDGGGGTGNILSSQLVNPSNGGIFTDWQILDITQHQHDTGFAAFDASALLPNDVIRGVQLSGADFDAETVLNIAPATTAMVTGTGFTDAGLIITHSSASGDSLAVTFNNTDAATALGTLTLDNLTSTGDATVSIVSTGAAGTQLVGYNGIGTLSETDGHLKTVTVTGNDYFNLGYSGGVGTDSATTSTANITSALAKIDASATTGGVSIYAGNTTLDGSFWETSYKGLTLDGGSGPGDVLYNGAAGGVTIDGNGEADVVWLGGSNASGSLGTGASDVAVVGNSAYSTAVTPSGPEAPGSALRDTVTFGAGGTAEIIIGGGAEWDGSTYAGKDANSGVGQTTVVGAVAAGGASPGTLIDLSHIVGASTNIVNAQGVTAGASNLTAAENTATAALGGVGVAYFTYGSHEYLVAAHTVEAAVSVGDAVVALHGVSITGLSMAAGVVHLV